MAKEMVLAEAVLAKEVVLAEAVLAKEVVSAGDSAPRSAAIIVPAVS